MTEAFSKLHQYVVQITALFHRKGCLGLTKDGLDEIGVLGKDRLVQLLLEDTHGNREDDLCHWW